MPWDALYQKLLFQPDNILYAPSSINMASVCYEHFYSAAYTYYIFILYIQGLQ